MAYEICESERIRAKLHREIIFTPLLFQGENIKT
jgi:hypothetical protein